MSYVSSDMGRFYRASDGTRMISYVAIPQDIPAIYRSTLIQLGRNCLMARGKPGYVAAVEELDAYERKLRKEFGKVEDRPEFVSQVTLKWDAEIEKEHERRERLRRNKKAVS